MRFDMTDRDWNEFFHQCSIAKVLQCSPEPPINCKEMLEPCLRGCDKINSDEKMVSLLRNVYQRRNGAENNET